MDQRGFTPLVIVLVILGIVLIAGPVYYVNQNRLPQITSGIVQPLPTINQTTTTQDFQRSCTTNADCVPQIMSLVCQVDCSNKDPMNKTIAAQMRTTDKSCKPPLWDPPAISCHCVQQKCTNQP